MRLIVALVALLCLQGCAFVATTAAGFIGTVSGNLVSDHLKDAEKAALHRSCKDE